MSGGGIGSPFSTGGVAMAAKIGASPLHSKWPGAFLNPGPHIMGGVQCIRGEIVCPAYCLIEDEYGCKSCPCGPGMFRFHSQNVKIQKCRVY